MKYNLDGKTVVITGASMGIGADLARSCVRRGAHVVLAARSREKLEALEKELNVVRSECALSVACDVTKTGDVTRLVAQALAKWDRIDVWVNNAGFGLWGEFPTLPMEEIRQVFETNVFAAVSCAQAAIPHLKKHGGILVNVESIVGLRSLPMASGYCASKHALHAFSEAARAELKSSGVQVMSVCPGLIATCFHENRKLVGTDMETGPRWLYMPSDRCAEKIARAIECRRSQIIVTAHAKLAAIVQRISPRLLDWLIAANFERMKQRC